MQLHTQALDPSIINAWFGEIELVKQPMTLPMTLKGVLARKYLPQGEASPLVWHPRYPVLCTPFITTLWDRYGQVVQHFSEGSYAFWSPDGLSLIYLVRNDNDYPTHINLYHQPTATLYELRDCSLLYDAVFHPSAPFITLVTPQALYYWDFTRHEIARIPCPQITTRAIATWSPDGERLIITRSAFRKTKEATDSGSMIVYDQKGTLLCAAPADFEWLYVHRENEPCWHPSGELFVTSHHYGLIWWSRDGEILAQTRLEPTEQSSPRVAWNTNGTLLAVGRWEGVYLLRADSSLERLICDSKSSSISSIDWHPDGCHLAVGRWGSSVEVWSIDGALQTTLPLWEVDAGEGWGLSGEALLRTAIRAPLVIRWDPSGSLLACALRDFSLYLYGTEGA
jgi:WD40 repeat protein